MYFDFLSGSKYINILITSYFFSNGDLLNAFYFLFFKSRCFCHPTMKKLQIAGMFAEGTGKRNWGLYCGSHTHLEHTIHTTRWPAVKMTK